MFAKPFNLILVYILTIFNFVILLLPILAITIPFINLNDGKIIVSNFIAENIKISLILLIFTVSFLMLCYLLLDFIFGFSQKSSLKDCKRYDKIKGYEFLNDIFSQVKKKFGENSVKLYVKNSNEINAFAIGSVGRKSIAVTVGLINHYRENTEDEEEFLVTLRSIIGHEMSHLVNKDFWPALFIITNQNITNFVSSILQFLLRIIITVLGFLRMRGGILGDLFLWAYNIINFILVAFNRYVIYNISEFLSKFVSRSIEYRCDRQSAHAFGGYNMGLALALLGESGYFTLFSTHPRTKLRIKKVEYLKIKNGTIRPPISSSISNYISLMLLVLICAICAKEAKIDIWFRYYVIENPEKLHNSINYIHNLISNLIIKFK